MRTKRFAVPFTVFLLGSAVLGSRASGQDLDIPQTLNGLPLLFSETFDDGMSRWETTDSSAWAVVSDDGDPVLALFQQSEYQPPVRSPHNMALVKDLWVSDFVLEAIVKSTVREYGHRDLVFFFGWQDPAHMYYVHIASEADPHANSIFRVDGEPRVSIATERTDGTKWENGRYHRVRIVRSVEAGTIQVFFDDMNTPIMTAEDDTFAYGRLGVGSFDDLGLFDDIHVWGTQRQIP